MAEELQVYSIYCNYYEKAIQELKSGIGAEQFRAALSAIYKKSIPELRRLELQDFLIKPLQRVCKYPLFFKELQKYTPPTHPDYEDLLDAVEDISVVVRSINTGKAEDENLNQLIEVKKRLEGIKNFPLVNSQRRLIKEGPAIKLNRTGIKQTRQLFLFNDVLIYAKPKSRNSNTFIYKGIIMLHDLYINEVNYESTTICMLRGDKRHKFDIKLTSQQETKAWAEKFGPAIKSNTKKTKKQRTFTEMFLN